MRDRPAEGQELFRKAFMNCPCPLSLNRVVDGKYVYVNEEFSALMGWSREEAAGKTPAELGIIAVEDEQDHILSQLGKTGKIINVEISLRSKKGKAVRCLLSANTLSVRGDQYKVFIINALSPAREKAEPALLDIGDHIVEMIGYSRDELGDVKAAQLISSGSENSGILKDTGTYRIEAVKKDGTSITVEVGGVETMFQGRTVRMLSIMDLTGRKEMEDALKKSSQLAIIGQIASGIAHEINNPLATISASNEAIMARIPAIRKNTSDDPDMKHNLDLFEDYHSIIKHEVERSGKIIQDLLSLAKFGEYNMRPVDLEKLVDSTVHLLEIQSRMKDYLFKSTADKDMPFVMADSDRLRQVLIILLTNATESMKSGGLIEIISRFDSRSERILLSVVDQGAGLEGIETERIFEPFYTTKGSRGGTGLGLSIAESIVARHKGEIKVEANPEKGATFTISLPAVSKEEADTEGIRY